MYFTHLFSWVIWRLSCVLVVINSFIGHNPASCTCAVKGLVTFRDRYRNDLGRTRYVITVHYLIRHNLACFKEWESWIPFYSNLKWFEIPYMHTPQPNISFIVEILLFNINVVLMRKKNRNIFCFKDLKIEATCIRRIPVYTTIIIWWSVITMNFKKSK